jgi:hypothetical protein
MNAAFFRLEDPDSNRGAACFRLKEPDPGGMEDAVSFR